MSYICEEFQGIKWLIDDGKMKNYSVSPFAKTISARKDGEITVIRQVDKKTTIFNQHNCDKPVRKVYNVYANLTKTQLAKLVETNVKAYEVMPDSRVKVFFDIEGDNVDKLPKAKEIINATFPNAKIQVSGSIGPNVEKKSKMYYSYHVVLSNYYLDSIADRAYLKQFVSQHSDVFDSNIKSYDKNGRMKCINQSKIEKKQRIQAHMEGSPKIPKHLITCYFDKDSKDAVPFLKTKLVDNVVPKTNGSRTGSSKPRGSDENNELLKCIQRLSIPSKYKMDLDPDEYDLNNMNALDLINLIPNPPRSDNSDQYLNHTFIYTVANFAKWERIKFNDFWKWAQTKDNSSSRQNKWIKKWKDIKVEFGELQRVKRKRIIQIIHHIYPEFNRSEALNYFIKQHKIEATKMMDTKYANKKTFTKKKIQFLHLGMGGAKTCACMDKLKEADSFCWITPRCSLSKNAKGRIGEDEYITIKNEELLKVRDGIDGCKIYTDFKNQTEKTNEIPKCDKIIVQAESLKYIGDRTYDYVVIDEIETLNNCWRQTKTHNDKSSVLKKNFENYVRVLQNAKQIFILDAFLTKKTIQFMKKVCPKASVEIIQSDSIPSSRKVKLIKQSKKLADDYKKWRHMIVQDIKDDKNLYVFYPFVNGTSNKESIEDLKMFIADNAKIDPNDDIITYYGSQDDKTKETLSEVNNLWDKKRVVITNNAITVGVNFDKVHFDRVYIAYVPFLHPHDIIQASLRVRKLKTNEVVIVRLANKQRAEPNYNLIDIDNKYHKFLVKELNTEDSYKDRWECFIYMCGLAHFYVDPEELIGDTKENIDEIIENQRNIIKNEGETDKEIRSCFDGSIFEYQNIPKLNYDQFEATLRKVWAYDASTSDKLAVEKYIFDSKITLSKKEKMYSPKVHNLWQLRKSVDTYHKYLKKPDDHWLTMAMNEFNINSPIFPDSKTINKQKLSPQLRKKIFESFDFRSVNEKSSDYKVLSRALSTFFGFILYEYDKKTDIAKMTKSATSSINLIHTYTYDKQAYMFD